MSVTDLNWREWDLEDWNEALFDHFFLDLAGEDRPVHRIPVTGDELLKVVGDPEARAEEVQEAFLAVLRTPTHKEFNHRLSRYPIDHRIGWKGDKIPPYFVDLAFSCLVASPPDGEIRGVGDFRKRLALLMGHDRSEAYYPLETLAPLWQAFGRWLDTKRAKGVPCRRLELPPLDHRVRIGYSLSLAFPSRKDLKNLIKTLSRGGLTSDPPIQTVFVLVGKQLHTFSRGFRRSYEEFREAFRTRKRDLDQYPFWGAVREAVNGLEDSEANANEEELALKLVMEPGGLVLLLSDAPKEVIKGELSFVEADTDYGEFQNVLCVGQDFEEGIESATRGLLGGRYHELLLGKGWHPIRIALEQGVLLFMRTERSWELAFTLREEGDCRVIVKDSLTSVLIAAFPGDERPQSRRSRYRGWTELECFPGKWLPKLRYHELSPLAHIRSLQPTVRSPQITMIGGCPIDGGYLGIPECLPSVRAPFCTKVELVSREKMEGGDTIHLIEEPADSTEFVFPGDLVDHLDGCFLFLGSRGNRVLVRKEVVFRPEIVVNTYLRPSNSEAWLFESGGPDVVTYGEFCNWEKGEIVSPQDNETNDRSGRTESTGSGYRFTPNIRIRDWQRYHTPESPHFCHQGSSHDFEASWRLMEICGGLASRRKGIREIEFLEFVRKTLRVDRYRSWEIARAWEEAGYIDRLMFRKWSRTDYFPRNPRFVLGRDGSKVRGVLSGLATNSLRSRADVFLLEKSVIRLETSSFSEWVPPVPMWVASDTNAFEEVSRSLELGSPIWIYEDTFSPWSLSRVVSSEQDTPRFHDCWGCWDWDRGSFVRGTNFIGKGVEVARFVHVQRPAFYQVLVDGEHVWWSYSRNWALLLAHDLLGIRCFAFSGADQVVRTIDVQIYLPLPMGRYLSFTCPTLSGPMGRKSGGYCYQFLNSSERNRFMSSIWGESAAPIEELRRWGQWMLCLSRRPPSGCDCRAVSLPWGIRQELDGFADIPEFRELSRSRVDPSLLAWLRNGLARFTKGNGK